MRKGTTIDLLGSTPSICIARSPWFPKMQFNGGLPLVDLIFSYAAAGGTDAVRGRRSPMAALASEHFTPETSTLGEVADAAPSHAGNAAMPTVLLIEDDRETGNEIMAELVDRGFQVDWAATGIEGLDKARAGNADVMIVDRLLPGVDGLTIIAAVRGDRI